jgi:hypothetical protein
VHKPVLPSAPGRGATPWPCSTHSLSLCSPPPPHPTPSGVLSAPVLGPKAPVCASVCVSHPHPHVHPHPHPHPHRTRRYMRMDIHTWHLSGRRDGIAVGQLACHISDTLATHSQHIGIVVGQLACHRPPLHALLPEILKTSATYKYRI